MTSADTESGVTKTASFLVVPASRNEWASTRAPGMGVSKGVIRSHEGIGAPGAHLGGRYR